MQNTAYDAFDDEYGFEDIEDDEQYLAELGGSYAQPPGSYFPGQGSFTGYDDIEDFEDDLAFSSPSPPERIHNQYPSGPRANDQHHLGHSQHQDSRPTFHRQPIAALQPQTRSTHPMQYTQNSQSYSNRNEPSQRPSRDDYFQHNTQPRNPVASGSQARNRDPPRTQPSMSETGTEQRGSNPRNAHGIRLRPTSDLPDMYRALFKFGVFNAVQSTCYDTVMHSDNNMVISAPTGSGKTVLFELAIIRMLVESSRTGRQSKCIYVAPTKALCSEKYREWTTKFQSLGINCCELTGDTVQFGKSVWGDAKNATVIVTTGEKWDSLTRNWDDHQQILSQIQLFLVDEVHILNETRGSTLEVVISRMKFRGTSVRFVLVSATVPNIHDVAAWIGNGPQDGPALVKEFGEEYRPCKLARHVVSVYKKRETNDFSFQRTLDFKLYGVLQTHSVDKPVLIFCSTRKGVMASAEQLMKEYESSLKKREKLPWTKPGRCSRSFHDKKLEKLAEYGIGIHHAGMTWDDRRATEDLFLQKALRVVVATSTLAVGVNLPAHTVIIKGVRVYHGTIWKEYSDLDIMQMMGRAGRPQFDKEGVAIIMCEQEFEAKYRALAHGATLLESSLHTNLSEHINSEIGLGTITNIDSAKQWLHSSFLFQRIRQNPRHYSIGKDGDQTWQERIDEMVLESIDRLKETQLVESFDSDPDSLVATELGDIMSKYYIKQSTMSLILRLPEKATLREMLEALSAAEEFADIKIRHGEKQIYNKLGTNDAIRFKIKKVDKTADKISLIIQAVLGGISLSDSEYKNGDNQPSLEAVTVFKHIARISRAMVDVAIARSYGAQIKYGMELMRCLSAKAWEDRAVVLRQIDQIGEKSIKVLMQHGITSLQEFRKQNPLRIETLLNRRPPFGTQVLAIVNQFPRYHLEIEEVGTTPSDGTNPVEVELSVTCGLLDDNQPEAGKLKKSKSKYKDMSLILTITSDLECVDFRKIATKALKSSKTFVVTAMLTKPSQSVLIQISSESIAGVTVTQAYKPDIPSSAYPTVNTRPQTAVERDIELVNGDENYWNAVPSDDEVVVARDLTKSGSSTKTSQLSKETSKRPSPLPSQANADCDPLYAPKVLPNGNYACNHSCKDKTACRHLCCREGLTKPPVWTKKRIEKTFSAEASQARAKTPEKAPSSAITKPKTKSTPKLDKPDRRMRQLEDLHQGTNVKASIQLQEGQRIKLDNGKRDLTTVRKKRLPTFDIAFSDLKAGESADHVDIPERLDSDDELPDTRDVLTSFTQKDSAASKSSSETRYSDPDIDNFIANARSPAPGGSFTDVKRTTGYPDELDLTMSSPPVATPPLTRKRPLDDAKDAKTSKKFKMSSPDRPAQRSAEPQKKPLFYRSPFEDPEAEVDQLAEDHFELDESIFDIQPALSPSPVPSQKGKSVSTGWESSSRQQCEPTFARPRTPPKLSPPAQTRPEASASTQTKTTDEPKDNRHPWDVALEEFEAWLESDAVVIVEKMD